MSSQEWTKTSALTLEQYRAAKATYHQLAKAKTLSSAEVTNMIELSTQIRQHLLNAAYHALRSYQYGNAETQPAKDIADELEPFV